MNSINKKNNNKMWIIVSAILFVLALVFNLYWFINMSNDFLPIFIYSVVMILSVATLANSIISVIREDRANTEEKCNEIVALINNTVEREFAKYNDDTAKKIVDEVVYNQKIAAKIGVERTKEGTTEIIEKIDDIQNIIEEELLKKFKEEIFNTVKLVVSDTVNSAFLNNINIVAPVKNEVINENPTIIKEPEYVVQEENKSELDSETEGMLNSLLDEFDTNSEIKGNEFEEDSVMDELISEITMDEDISINSALEKIEEKMQEPVADIVSKTAEEIEPEVEPEVEQNTEIPLPAPTETTDDPNRKMTPDEIAALIASMGN